MICYIICYIRFLSLSQCWQTKEDRNSIFITKCAILIYLNFSVTTFDYYQNLTCSAIGVRLWRKRKFRYMPQSVIYCSSSGIYKTKWLPTISADKCQRGIQQPWTLKTECFVTIINNWKQKLNITFRNPAILFHFCEFK